MRGRSNGRGLAGLRGPRTAGRQQGPRTGSQGARDVWMEWGFLGKNQRAWWGRRVRWRLMCTLPAPWGSGVRTVGPKAGLQHAGVLLFDDEHARSVYTCSTQISWAQPPVSVALWGGAGLDADGSWNVQMLSGGGEP